MMRALTPFMVMAALGAVEPGDPGAVVRPDLLIADYPAMAGWAAAGVAGGVPPRSPPRVVVEPGMDVAAAISGGGSIRLAPGIHRIDRPIAIPAGTDLHGDGPDHSVIELGDGGSLVAERVARVGLRGLRITHAASAAELAARPIDPAVQSDRPASGIPARHVAVRLAGVEDSWIEDCRITAFPDAPLAIDGVRRVAIRRVRIDGAVHRGSGSGVLRIHGMADSLIHRVDIDGIRSLRLGGAVHGTVIAASAFAVPVQFSDSAAVTGNLFENNLHAIPPGSPWRAFAWGVDPIGPGNLVVGGASYAQGTDAVVNGVLLRPGAVLAIARTPQRGTWDAEASIWRATPLLAPPMRTVAAAAAGIAAQPIPARTSAAGLPVSTLGAGPITGLAWSADPLADGWDAAPTWKQGDSTAVPAERIREGAIDVLGLAGDKRIVRLAGVLEVSAESDVMPVLGGAGQAAWWVSGVRIAADMPLRLAPGRHELVGAVRVAKPNPFTKRIDVRLAFAAAPAQTGGERMERLGDPPSGTLYASTAPIGPGYTAGWDEALSAHRLLAAAEPPELEAALSDLVRRHGDAPIGRLAARWQQIVTTVESRPLAADGFRAWRSRSTAYFLAGLPQRSWAFERLVEARWPGAPEDRPERIIP